MKKLYRSDKEKMICGVCGGIAEYLEMDPTIVRIIVAILGCMAGSGLFIYFIMALIIPKQPEVITVYEHKAEE